MHRLKTYRKCKYMYLLVFLKNINIKHKCRIGKEVYEGVLLSSAVHSVKLSLINCIMRVANL